MLIGGAPGSTAGGIKTVTFAILALTVVSSISENKTVIVFKREVKEETIKKAVTVGMLALLIISLASILLVTWNPQIAFIDILFEVISALATCGYSLGITPSLTVSSKVLLMLIMYIGRVSTVTMTMALTGSKFKQTSLAQYPKADIHVG